MSAFSILWEALAGIVEEVFYLWLMGFITLVGWVLVLPAPPVTAGLWYVAHRVVRGYAINMGTYWEGVKAYGGRSYLVALVALFGYAILAMNLWFYGVSGVAPIQDDAARIVVIFWAFATLLWTGAMFYFEAFLIEQVEPKLTTALRNSVGLMVLHPFKTLFWLIALVALLALSIFVPILVGMFPSLFAMLSITATRRLVQGIKAQAEEEGEGTGSTER